MTAIEFIKRFERYTRNALQQKVFPATSLAIAYLEANKSTGLSTLASKYNNYHGIQNYPAWKGPTVRMKDNQVGNYREFCVYPTPAAGFQGFIDFLKRNPRYEKAGVFRAKTAKEQVKAIAAAGYSESSQWQKLVNSIAEQYSDSSNKIIDLISLIGTVLIFGYSVINLLSSLEGMETSQEARK